MSKKFTRTFSEEELAQLAQFLGELPMKYAQPIQAFISNGLEPVEVEATEAEEI